MQTNKKGFRKIENGKLVVTSEHSVFGTRLTTGTYTVPVTGMPGVFALLTAGEYAQLTERPETMTTIAAKAREVFPEPSKSGK